MIGRSAKNFAYCVLYSPRADGAILTAGNEGSPVTVECQRVDLVCLRKLYDRSWQHDNVATKNLLRFRRGISPHRIDRQQGANIQLAWTSLVDLSPGGTPLRFCLCFLLLGTLSLDGLGCLRRFGNLSLDCLLGPRRFCLICFLNCNYFLFSCFVRILIGEDGLLPGGICQNRHDNER